MLEGATESQKQVESVVISWRAEQRKCHQKPNRHENGGDFRESTYYSSHQTSQILESGGFSRKSPSYSNHRKPLTT